MLSCAITELCFKEFACRDAQNATAPPKEAAWCVEGHNDANQYSHGRNSRWWV